MSNSPFLQDNNAFEPYGSHHLYALVFFTALALLLIVGAKYFANKKQQIAIGNAYACFLSFVIIAWTSIKIMRNDFDVKSDLPFHLCNLMALLMPLLSFTRKRLLYEILLFWVFAGTIQALITPDLSNGFPHYTYFKYWFAHAGVIVFMLYATVIYKLRPDLKSIVKSFLALQLYVVFVFIINLILDSNYFYINRKPDAATLLDFFGDWPYYIIVAELVLIPFFFIIYLPFYLVKKLKPV